MRDHNDCGACICCDMTNDLVAWDAMYGDHEIGVDCCDPESWED